MLNLRRNGLVKTLAVLFFLAVLFYALTIYWGDKVKKQEPSAPVPSEEQREGNTLVSVEGFRLVDSDFSRIKMDISAKKAELIKRRFRHFRLAIGNVIEMEKPVVKVYDDSGGRTVITGEKATLDPAKKVVLFIDGCKVDTPDGTRLKAGVLAWKYSRGFIEVRGDYLLTKDGTETAGRNGYLDLKLGKIKSVL